MTTKTTTRTFLPEVRGRAVRMLRKHAGEHPTRWAAVQPVTAKIGCSAQTLHDWTRKAEVDAGQRAGVPSEAAEKLKALERENRGLRQANGILRQAAPCRLDHVNRQFRAPGPNMLWVSDFTYVSTSAFRVAKSPGRASFTWRSL